MQKVLPFLFLGFGLLNIYYFIQTFTTELTGPFQILFWETGLTGYRIKCLVFAAVFIFAFWGNYKRLRK